MIPIISTPALPAETGGHHQRPQQWQGQEEKENAETPSLRGKQEEQQPQQQQHQDQEQKQQSPALFPPPSSTTATNSATPTSSSSSSCPNLEDLVDRFFTKARRKFLEQFDETAKTMSSTMKNEIALRSEQERQRRAEWEVSVVDSLNKEVDELRASRDQLARELDMVRMPMVDTPSLLKSGMLCMSGRDPKLPCATPAAGAGQPLRTPASRLSIFSLSSASGVIDVIATSGDGMSPPPFRGLFPAASAIKLVPSPLAQQPPQLQLQSLPQLESQQQSESQPRPLPQPQPQPLPSEVPAVDVVVATTPTLVPSRPATPSSVCMAGARAAAFEGARLTTGNDEIAAAVAAAAQSAWLSTYYSSNPQSMPSDAPAPSAAPVHAPAPTASPVLAPAPSVASTTPAADASRVDVPSTFDSVMAIVDEHQPTAEITTADVSETVYQPVVVKAIASPPVVPVTSTVGCSVQDGGVTAKVRDGASVMASSTSTAVVATKPKDTTPSFATGSSSSVGRRSSMPVGGLSRQRISVPAGLPFAVVRDDMPPPQPQPKTPCPAMKSPMRFGATPARSPLGTLNVNTVNTRLSSNTPGMKKPAGHDSAGRSDGGGCCFVDGGSTAGDDKRRTPLATPAASHDGRKVIETARQGVRYASSTASSATKRADGDGVNTSESPRKGTGSITTKRAKQVLPQSQRVLRSATRASRAAAAAEVTTATKHSSRRASAAKTTLPVPAARTTRSATLRSAGRTSGSRGSFMKF